MFVPTSTISAVVAVVQLFGTTVFSYALCKACLISLFRQCLLTIGFRASPLVYKRYQHED